MNSSKEIEKNQEYSLPQWSENYGKYRGTVRYGMHYICGNSQPYFSITGDTYHLPKGSKNWQEDSCGCLHDLIRKKAKHLAPLIKFHLCDQNGLPMYYLENGYYWYKENLKTFKSYIRLAEGEIIPEVPKVELPVVLTEIDLPEKEQGKIIESARKEFITGWLRTREPKLKKEFEEAMMQFNVEFISQEEIDAIKAKNKTA